MRQALTAGKRSGFGIITDKMILITAKLKCEGRSHIMEHRSESDKGLHLLTQKAVHVILGKTYGGYKPIFL